jgi:hypothetical protein
MATDHLRLLDGGSLQGRLESIATGRGVGWQYPEALRLIEFAPSNIAYIRLAFEPAPPPPAQAVSRLRFANGDELFGALLAVSDRAVEFQLRGGDRLAAPRASLDSVLFLPRGHNLRYEGPTGLADWQQSLPRRAWKFDNGALSASGLGIIGRDFKLTDSSSIEFDLGWTGQFNMLMAIYAGITDRLDYIYNQSSYLFFFSPGFVTLQRVQAGAGTIQLGYAQIPQMTRRNPVHIEIRTSKEDATIGLLVNGETVQRWKDSSGFVGQGTGVLFHNQMDTSPIRISQLKVVEWDVRLEFDPAEITNRLLDVVHLANQDVVSGQLQSLSPERLDVRTPTTSLQVPLERVRRILFASPVVAPREPNPWLVRAHLGQGGQISFGLDDWNRDQVSGRSPLFGPVRLVTRSIRQLQFNLDRTASVGSDPTPWEDSLWDLHE